MRSPESVDGVMEPSTEIDLRALGAALKRRRKVVFIPALLAFVLIAIFVNVVSPRYTGEAQVLLENQETFFTRPDRGNVPEQQAQVDQEGVASQVQLVNSPDIARRAIQDLSLAGNPEFDPSATMNPLKQVLVLLGLARDPSADTVETRITKAFLDKLSVFSPPKTRVITIQFSSKDPGLAARGANVVADLYIQEQSAAKRAMAKDASEALASQIADLRTKLASADGERERYRVQTGLVTGSNNLTINGQQLADINSDLSKARSTQADAQAKSSMIRELLRSGKAADIPDVINNDLVRRVSEQRSTAQAELALEGRSLLPGHPRMKALQAQVAEYDLALKAAAKQAASSLENEAKIAGTRVANLETVLTQQTKAAGASNVDEVHLRALERTTQGLKDQLESSMTKYQEALARQASDATPADARIITRAGRPDEPSFPKKLPFIAFGTVAALIFSIGFIIAGELLSGRPGPDVAPKMPLERPAPVQRPIPQQVVAAEPLLQRPAAQHKPRRVQDLLRSLASAPAEEPDLVFAPAPDARRTTLASTNAPKQGLVAAVLAYVKGFGRSAADSRVIDEPQAFAAAAPAVSGVGWDPLPQVSEIADEPPQTQPLADQILAAHVPGRGLHIVGAGLGDETRAVATLVDLSRTLAGKGRSIIVDLNRTPTKLAALCEGAGEGDGRARILTMNGLAELLAGDSSFAEVIYRDASSRLHFIPSGRQEADFRDFDLILDALSETYDFVVMLAPALPQSEIAKVMAPYADFVVVAAAGTTDDVMIGLLEKELVEAGARQVLVTGAAVDRRRSRQDVA